MQIPVEISLQCSIQILQDQNLFIMYINTYVHFIEISTIILSLTALFIYKSYQNNIHQQSLYLLY